MDYSKYQIKIISILYNAGMILTTNEIAKYSKISRITAKKHLDALLIKECVEKRVTLNKNKKIYKIEWKLKTKNN